ncbi:unnamed protein product [Echinostoma caproni]|uniref:Uncharacterized protein n=1 Tax=Echinostoma caproni TaxID=27848 RepID=A0A183AX05_9TREM|nr:unnamed protein product [Echinostoma caproni]
MHRPGKTIPQADFLSRWSKFAAAKKCYFIATASLVSGEELRRYTKRYYAANITALSKGWRPYVKLKFAAFYAHREEISVQTDGILCRNDGLFIPPPLRKVVLKDLHKSHFSIR